jgi:hypothetical protein
MENNNRGGVKIERKEKQKQIKRCMIWKIDHRHPHPAEANAPYVPQGVARVNLFDTFDEEHMEPPPYPGAPLGPGHANTLPTTFSIKIHVFSTPLHSQTPYLMHPQSSFYGQCCHQPGHYHLFGVPPTDTG